MSRVLVTGAAGFLGSHLCDRLLADGYEVVGMDNRISGQIDNLDDATANHGFSFYEHDVTEFVHVVGDLDWVIHLASLASPVHYRDNKIKNLKVGGLGTHKTLGLAKEKDAKYFFASTSEVYGDPDVNPQPESYRGNVDPYGPRSCYDESKRYGEALVRAYREEHGVDVRVARIFNTYGPRMALNDGRVVPNFVKQTLRDDPVTVYGDGTQTRSFCYVDDMIDAFRALMDTEVTVPVNVGNPDEREIRELAELLIDLTDSDAEIAHEPLPPDDPQVRRPDISRARTELDWSPSVTLREGLRRTIESLSEQIHGT